MFVKASVLAALATSASAHLRLHNPIPFAYEDTANAQAPLEPADFPCKQPGGTYAVTTMNTVAAGDVIQAQIIGGATHGGGSCQFSITTDTKPNKDTQWKVLHSQIHGCLGGPNNDNMSGDKDDLGNPQIPVTIPADLAAGEYTFAWSWFNKLGNREFYMNCAPLTVTGDGKGTPTEVLGSKPDMFVANLPSEECQVDDSQDFVYPNPGDSVATGEGAVPGTAVGGPGCASMTLMGAGAGKLGSPAAATGAADAPSSAAAEPVATTPAAAPVVTEPAATPVVTAAPSNDGGVFAPAASSAAAAPASTPAASAPETGNSSASGDCTKCDTDGAVVCIGTDSYGLCNFGCAVAQKLAEGMTCSSGAIIAKSSRRALKFPRDILHKRHAALHARSN